VTKPKTFLPFFLFLKGNLKKFYFVKIFFSSPGECRAIYTVQKKKRIGGVARVNEPARGQYLKIDSDFDLEQPRTVSSMIPHKNFAKFAALKWVSG